MNFARQMPYSDYSQHILEAKAALARIERACADRDWALASCELIVAHVAMADLREWLDRASWPKP